MARRDTKADILAESLRLFARAGYDGVGMRDIAAAVGIQPASLYKHYAGKQAILDAIVEHMNKEYEQRMIAWGTPRGSVPEQAMGYGEAVPGTVGSWGEVIFRYWTEDEQAVLFRRMLTMEQYRSPAIGELYRRYFVEAPVAFQAKLFERMMDDGFFARDNAYLMALEFFAPMPLLMQKADGAKNDEERNNITALVRAYVERFGNLHSVQSELTSG